jgi:hypothetical protein
LKTSPPAGPRFSTSSIRSTSGRTSGRARGMPLRAADPRHAGGGRRALEGHELPRAHRHARRCANHFEPDRPDVSEIPAGDLFAPGVVIDVTMQAERDPDYGLTVADVEAWEARHGRIPDRAIVLLRTGWGRFWSNPVRFRNADARGTLHFPAYEEESARLLVEERNVRPLGIDNLSIDRRISKNFAVHHVVNKASRYAIGRQPGETPATGVPPGWHPSRSPTARAERRECSPSSRRGRGPTRSEF